jgi:hypothetical protein
MPIVPWQEQSYMKWSTWLAYLETKTVSKEKQSLKERPQVHTRTGSDKTNPNDIEGNYGFLKCVALARTLAPNTNKNPDNYRIFAEMSMSPATEWRAPNPAT